MQTEFSIAGAVRLLVGAALLAGFFHLLQSKPLDAAGYTKLANPESITCDVDGELIDNDAQGSRAEVLVITNTSENIVYIGPSSSGRGVGVDAGVDLTWDVADSPFSVCKTNCPSQILTLPIGVNVAKCYAATGTQAIKVGGLVR